MEKEFARRLTKLRMQKNVSARDMSLSLGKSPGYIFEIESREMMPSMGVFFFICDFLDVTPEEFFAGADDEPVGLKELIRYLKKLTPAQINHIREIVLDMLHI